MTQETGKGTGPAMRPSPSPGFQPGFQSPSPLFRGLAIATSVCHGASLDAGWWRDPATGEDLRLSKLALCTKIALIHSEVSEALEGLRKDLPDTHLPQHPSVAVELADALIRIFDLAGAMNLDLASAFIDKLDYNLTRADHKLEARQAPGGKSF